MNSWPQLTSTLTRAELLWKDEWSFSRMTRLSSPRALKVPNLPGGPSVCEWTSDGRFQFFSFSFKRKGNSQVWSAADRSGSAAARDVWTLSYHWPGTTWRQSRRRLSAHVSLREKMKRSACWLLQSILMVADVQCPVKNINTKYSFENVYWNVIKAILLLFKKFKFVFCQLTCSCQAVNVGRVSVGADMRFDPGSFKGWDQTHNCSSTNLRQGLTTRGGSLLRRSRPKPVEPSTSH